MARIGTIDALYANDFAADVCPYCKQISEHNIKLQQRAFLIGFPLFPISKQYDIECMNCRGKIQLGNMPKYTADKYLHLLNTKKPSIWIYSFSYFIIFMIIFMSIKTYFDNNKFEEYIKSPIVGDIYETKRKEKGIFSDDYLYSYMRVVDIENNMIGFQKALYEAPSDKKSEILYPKEDAVWLDDTIYYYKTELINHLDGFRSDKNFSITEVMR
ncbi:MAG: hypothetical protein KC414_14665 [Romboutsia sp.]|nr:hypothetical protein [Romboutsia sp.]